MNGFKGFRMEFFLWVATHRPTPQQLAAAHHAASQMRAVAGPVASRLVYSAAFVGTWIDNARGASTFGAFGEPVGSNLRG